MTYAGGFECQREDSSGTMETKPKRERQQEGARCGVVDHVDGASRDLEIGGNAKNAGRLARRDVGYVSDDATRRCSGVAQHLTA